MGSFPEYAQGGHLSQQGGGHLTQTFPARGCPRVGTFPERDAWRWAPFPTRSGHPAETFPAKGCPEMQEGLGGYGHLSQAFPARGCPEAGTSPSIIPPRGCCCCGETAVPERTRGRPSLGLPPCRLGSAQRGGEGDAAGEPPPGSFHPTYNGERLCADPPPARTLSEPRSPRSSSQARLCSASPPPRAPKALLFFRASGRGSSAGASTRAAQRGKKTEPGCGCATRRASSLNAPSFPLQPAGRRDSSRRSKAGLMLSLMAMQGRLLLLAGS